MILDRVLHESQCFRLVRKRRKSPAGRGASKFTYQIVYYGWRGLTREAEEVMRDIVDPTRNKGGAYGSHWNFRSRGEAEKIYMLLCLRWN